MKHTHIETNLPVDEEYPKLVRDRIPEMIGRDSKTAVTHIAEPEEYIRFLLAKVVEEATELKGTEDADHEREEIADVQEVLDALKVARGYTDDEISEIQQSKAAERGGFADRIILELKPE